MRPAAGLLLIDAKTLPAALAAAEPAAFDRPTICDGWSVRDVLAHCAAALTDLVRGDIGGFTSEENLRAVDKRGVWPVDDVVATRRPIPTPTRSRAPLPSMICCCSASRRQHRHGPDARDRPSCPSMPVTRRRRSHWVVLPTSPNLDQFGMRRASARWVAEPARAHYRP